MQSNEGPMLVLLNKKQEQINLARAIEESKAEAGLNDNFFMQEDYNEEDQLQKAIEISRIEALTLVKKKSIDIKVNKNQTDEKQVVAGQSIKV